MGKTFRRVFSVAFTSGLVLLLSSTSMFVGPNLIGAASPYDDEFDSPSLDRKWSFDNEERTHWSLTANPSYLRIVTQLGDMPPSPDTGEARNVLLQIPPTGDYQITTKLDFRPTTGIPQAGLVIVDPADRNKVFLKLVRAFARDQQAVIFALATDGKIGFQERFEPSAGTTTYLRIQKRGEVFTGAFSADGAAWTQVTSYYIPGLANGVIGLAAFNAVPISEINADFDFFRVELEPRRQVEPTSQDAPSSSSPLRPLYSDEFDQAALDSRWSVTHEDRSHWSLTANPGFLRVITQAGNMPPSDAGRARNVLLQRSAAGDYEITTRVEFGPVSGGQQAGLVIVDPNNEDSSFLKLVRILANGQQSVDFALAAEGWNRFQERFTPFAGNTAFLRIQKRGQVLSGFVSADGDAWTEVASYEATALADGRIGITAFSAIPAIETSADFDYFRVQTGGRRPTTYPTRVPSAFLGSPC